MNHQRIVLLGTGTDVGKTYVGSQLARAWKKKVGPCLGLKPVESGVVEVLAPDAVPQEGDAGALARSATLSHRPCFALKRPISPHLAAREEGLTIELDEISNWVDQKEREFLQRVGPGSPTLTLVETAGGVFSPVSPTATNFELAQALGDATWILVAPDRLGVLHDVQACVRAMAARVPDQIVLSQAQAGDASTGINAEELVRIVFAQLGSLAPSSRVVPTVTAGGDAAQLLDLIQ